MSIVASIIYILSFVFWIAAVFWLPRTKGKESGLLWLVVSVVLYECWIALVSGLMSITNIPVTLISIAILNFISGLLITMVYSKFRGDTQKPELPKSIKTCWAGRQEFSFCKVDIAFAVCLAIFCVWAWYQRFGQEAAIIYATIDPADRFSRAVSILSERTVIGPYPNLYFTHISNAMFMGAFEPVNEGVFMVRSFIAKEMINVWLAGTLFYSALRQLSDKPYAKVIFFILGFAYALGFPWNNQLWGFGYLGVSVTLIILVLIGANILKEKEQNPVIGLIIIAAGCMGVGITYTVFAPPLFIAAFIAILLWKKEKPGQAFQTGIMTFTIPVVMVYIFTVVIGRGDAGSDLGTQFIVEGAIYRNLFGDFLIWMPLALFAVVLAISKKDWDFPRIFAIVFFIYQAYFLYRMLAGTVSTYYYYKLNFATWFIVLFLAGMAVVMLTKDGNRQIMAAIGCFLLIFFTTAVFTVSGYDQSLSRRGENVNPIYAANGLFGLYANNNAYFNYLEVNPVYFTWDFLKLAENARVARGEGDFYTNKVEIIADHFNYAYWGQALVGEHIQQKPVNIDFMPDSDAKIWIVIKSSELYKNNAEEISGYLKIFENDLGFVVVR